MANTYPKWHLRYLDARNKLCQACADMEQAVYESNSSPAFLKMQKAMDGVMKRVDAQLMRNFNRGRKEGWLK